MTKCKITIETNRSFDEQVDARIYLKKLVDAGILFIKCYHDGDQTRIKVEEVTTYQTKADAKRDLKKFTEAGILYLEVDEVNKYD